MKYSLITYGCQMNISDSERLSTVLREMGYEPTEDEGEADLLGIVACSVRQKAIDKVYGRIHEWNLRKDHRSLVTFLTGCVLEEDRKKFLKLFDLVFPITELPRLPDMIRQYGVVGPSAPAFRDTDDPATGFWRIEPSHGTTFEAYVPIQNGCDNFCAYCAVPYTRGREVSRSSGHILEEVRDLIDRGYRSITLLGQNVNSYGTDRPGNELRFSELLAEIGEYGERPAGRFWLYFTSPHPKDMGTDVLETVARYRSLGKQIHLPIQSGDDEVLRRMNRRYTVDDYRRVVENIRRLLPEATLFTDIIVGFPGETEEQFGRTLEALREFSYTMAYIAMYSPRPGSASARWEDDVPLDEKRRRLHVLSEELKRISGEANRALVGSTRTVLVMGSDRKEGYLSGKTEGRIIVRFPAADPGLIGSYIPIRITGASDMSVEGVPAE